MNSYLVAQRLTEQLKQPSVILSRKHPPQDVPKPSNFMTFHALIARIIRSYEKEMQSSKIDLLGGHMYHWVEQALQEIFDRRPTIDEIKTYYSNWRLYKNGSSVSQQLPFWGEFIERYSSFQEGLDWESSFHMAIHLLNNDYVSYFDKFYYQNLILVQPELLDYPWNRNAKAFFLSLCSWIERNNKGWNVFVADSHIVRMYQRGNFIPYRLIGNLH